MHDDMFLFVIYVHITYTSNHIYPFIHLHANISGRFRGSIPGLEIFRKINLQLGSHSGAASENSFQDLKLKIQLLVIIYAIYL